MIWLVPQASILEDLEQIGAYMFGAKIMIENHYTFLEKIGEI